MDASSKHIWDQLFTVDTIWNIGETGDIYSLSLTPSLTTLSIIISQYSLFSFLLASRPSRARLIFWRYSNFFLKIYLGSLDSALGPSALICKTFFKKLIFCPKFCFSDITGRIWIPDIFGCASIQIIEASMDQLLNMASAKLYY